MSRSLVLVLVISVMYVTAAEIELYSDKYDNLDPVAILANDQLREQYYDCFMDAGPCSPEGAEFFKGNFPEAVVTNCLKCTDRQKVMLDQIANWYATNQEGKWNALIAKVIDDAKRLNIQPV